MHLLVIAGPTATGKTALAAEVAHRLGTEIISADSRQVYRGLDIGTGKDLREYQKFQPHVPYHLIDIVDPEETYSLYNYQQACYRVIAERSHAARPVSQVMVMAGGTGMYMEAVLRRYRIANVTENPSVRNAFTGWAREDLTVELRRQDPILAERTDLSSSKRIIRALEIRQATELGTIEHSGPPEQDFTFTVFVTRMERSELRSRIDARVAARIKEGMIEEVEGLLKKGVTRDRMAVLGMEYRAISEYLAVGKSLESMTTDLCHQIHMLAKRQETYFRGMERRGVPITWLDPHPKAEAILDRWVGIEKEKARIHV